MDSRGDCMTPLELREWRIERKLSQQEAAEKLGYKEYHTIMEFESGKREIPRRIEMLIKFMP